MHILTLIVLSKKNISILVHYQYYSLNSLSIRKITFLKNWCKLIFCIQVNDSAVHWKAVPMLPSSIPEICEATDFVPKAFLCNFLISLQEHKQHIPLMSVKNPVSVRAATNEFVYVCVCVCVHYCQEVLGSAVCFLALITTCLYCTDLTHFWAPIFKQTTVQLWGNPILWTTTNKHCG